MREQAARAAAAQTYETSTGGGRLFYRLLLPLGVVANLALGLVVLANLQPAGWTDWLQIGTGAFCCTVAGVLMAALWSKVYWNRSMARQVALWRRIADTFFAWVEDAPLPAESVNQLEASLDKVMPAASGIRDVY